MRCVLIALMLPLACCAAAAPAFATAFAPESASAPESAPAGKVYTVATSHLDTQWRWTVQQTIAEYLRRTLDDNFDLLDRYPEYVFSFEGAFRYQLVKEYYPDRFERLRQYVAQGRWQVCGSWLDAVDVNMPSPEALFRHALYGNGFFAREFGVRSVDVFLPDCFGFGHALPSIMAHCGLIGFSTQKLTWGSAYGIPFDIGRWRGVDGREVLAAVNPGAYVSDLEGDVSRDSTVAAAIARTAAAGGPPVAFKYYGTGDTGGAPTEESVRWLQKSVASGGPIAVVSAGADQIFRELAPTEIDALPVYDGELVMTSHGVGCYTSQAAMKRWNRRCEVLGDAAERAAALAWWLGAQPYPGEELERAWTRFLWHGFHDDLTGTSIPEAYTFSWNDMLLSQQEFSQVIESSLAAVAGGLDTDVDGQAVVVFNPLGFPRTEMVVCRALFPNPLSTATASPFVQVHGPDDELVPAVMLPPPPGSAGDIRSEVAFLATVPAIGVAVYSIQPRADRDQAAPLGWNPDAGTLDTDRYRLRLSEAGLVSLFDKQTGRELLNAPPCLQLLRNEPANWAAWEIDYDDLMTASYAEVPLGGVPETVVAGPGLARLTFTHEAAGSVFRQTLLVRGDRLDWELDIDWATEATLLKAAFFTTARDTAVTYDLGLGTIRRGLNRPLLYEVPGQRWADLTDQSGDFGLAVLNDGRHGWDHPDPGTLRLTLLHTPAVNDRWRWIDDQKSQDLGRHRVTVSMVGHGSNWRPEVVRAADALNQPLLAFHVLPSRLAAVGPLGRSLSLLQVAGDRPEVVVRAIKKSEQGDWLVVRLQEIAGAPAANVELATAAPVTAVRELQADEEPIPAGDGAALRDGRVAVDLARYQPRTLALQLAPPPAGRLPAAVRSSPVALPWNVDGISTREQPTDGDLDGTGASLPSHLVPAVIERDGVRFETGPRAPGAANLLRCEGQTIELPRTDGTILRLLMCSVDGPRRGEFRTDRGHRQQPWIPDGRAFFGQWDSRVVGGDIVHDRADLVPAYTTDAAIGWVVTHRHGPQGQQEPYVFTHFYAVDVPLLVVSDAPAVTLPDDPSLVILAASVVTRNTTAHHFGRELVDRPTYPSVSIAAERRAFVDSLTVSLHSPNAATVIEVARGDGPAVVHDGSPLIVTDTTTLTVTARGPFPETTTRTAVFTRLDPWPAAAASPPRLVPGLATAVYHGAWERLPDWSALAPVQETVSEQVRIPGGVPLEDVGLVLRGWITVPAAGVYRFWLSSDDGSRLWLDERLVIDHDGLHGATAAWGEAPLAAGRHALVVEYFQHLGGRELKLEWSGPGFARQEVSARVLSAAVRD